MFKNIQSKSIYTALVVFIVLVIILSSVYAVLLLKDNFKSEDLVKGTNIILGVSALVSGFFAGLKNKSKGIIVGLLSALTELLLIFIFCIIFGKLNMISSNFFIKALLLIMPNIIGGIIGVNFKKKY